MKWFSRMRMEKRKRLLGLREECTGSGCSALFREGRRGTYVLVVSARNEGAPPACLREPALVGFYSGEACLARLRLSGLGRVSGLVVP
jgi:hypothetical protein